MSYFIPLEPDSALEDVYYFHMLRLVPRQCLSGRRLALPLPPMPMLTPPGRSRECRRARHPLLFGGLRDGGLGWGIPIPEQRPLPSPVKVVGLGWDRLGWVGLSSLLSFFPRVELKNAGILISET